MKQLPLIYLLLLTTLTFGQNIYQKDSTVFKKANVIQIYADMADEELYKIAGRTLIQEGFMIEKSDKDFLTLKTENQRVNGYSFKMSLAIFIVNKIITIKGNSSSGGFEFGVYYADGLLKTVPSEAFNKMNEYALRLKSNIGSGKIIYSREK